MSPASLVDKSMYLIFKPLDGGMETVSEMVTKCGIIKIMANKTNTQINSKE